MFTFQRRNKAQRKHQKASAKRSRSKPAARSRLFLEPLEDRTLLSGNPYTDFINIFDANLNGQATNLQTTLGNGFLPVENSLSNINDIPFLQGQNLFSQLKNAVIASSQFFSDFKNTLKSIQLPTTDVAVAKVITSTFPGLITFARVNSSIGPPESVEFDLHFHQDATTPGGQLPFSFGPQGLPFKLSGQGAVNVKVGFDYELDFQCTQQNNQTFTLLDQHLNDDPSQPQLNLTVGVGLASGQIDATLGFLRGTIQDYVGIPKQMDDATSVGLTFSLATAGATFTNPSLDGLAHLSLFLDGSFDVGGMNTANVNNDWLNASVQFPEITAHFVVDWGFGSKQQPLSVKFENLQLDLGKALSSFAGPIISVVQDVFGPLQPVFNFLTSPIPGVSDLSHLLGGADVTFLDAAKVVIGKVVGPEVKPVVDLVADLIPVIQEIDNIQSDMIPLGSFDLNTQGQGGDLDMLQNQLASFDFGDLSKSLTNLVPDGVPNDLTKNLDPTFQAGVNALTSVAGQLLGDGTGLSLTFPFLSGDVSNSLFKLFLGQDVDLVSFKASLKLPAMKDQDAFGGLDPSFRGCP